MSGCYVCGKRTGTFDMVLVLENGERHPIHESCATRFKMDLKPPVFASTAEADAWLYIVDLNGRRETAHAAYAREARTRVPKFTSTEEADHWLDAHRALF